MKAVILITVWLLALTAGFGQLKNKNKMKNDVSKNNPLLCDPEEGICEIPDSLSVTREVSIKTEQRLKVIYFTDPICSSCWGIEPQLRKLKLEYGHSIDFEYRMGGLLPDWTYNSGGISKPSDVAHHWDEVSVYYNMPIDGDLWLEDPLHSSYPPSIAFKAAQLQDNEKAIRFLRQIREMVFLEKKNITKWEHLEKAAREVGLNVDQLKLDFEGQGKENFKQDLAFAKDLGVRGFPTMFFVHPSGTKEIVYGSKQYAFYETAILKLSPSVKKGEYSKDWETLFKKHGSLTTREFSELSGMPGKESEALLSNLVATGSLSQFQTKNGPIWRLRGIGECSSCR